MTLIEAASTTGESGRPGPAGRSFRFGIQVCGAGSARQWRETAVRAEAQGYHVLLLPDHFGDQLAPIAALAAAAAVTSVLRLGTLVCGNDFRHPLVLAKEAATLDLLSEGRLELGVGAGWAVRDYLETGIAFDPPGPRVARLQEAVALVKAAWGGHRFDFSGTHYNVNGYTGHPLPVQRHRPPLLIGSGSQGLLRFAAREADIVAFAPRPIRDGTGLVWDDISAQAVARKVDWVRQAAADRFETLELSLNVFEVDVTADRAGAVDRLARRLGCPPDLVATSPHVWIGTVEHIAAQLRQHRERYGISYYTILGDPDLLASAAPVVAALATD